jgi:hypothetical protein
MYLNTQALKILEMSESLLLATTMDIQATVIPLIYDKLVIDINQVLFCAILK